MKKQTWIALIIVALVVGGIVAYRTWNKPHARVEDAKGISVDAAVLCAEFTADEAAAHTKYNGKVLDVSGMVNNTEQNQDGGTVVYLATADSALSVQCTMRDKSITVSNGDKVIIKGRYVGSDMFGVLLTDCILDK